MAYKRFEKNCVGCGISFMGTPKTKFCSVQCSTCGPNSHRWKGDNVGIDALHVYVRRRLPKPDKCECCQVASPYDLANIGNVYNRELKNWEWLCRRCHMEKDGRKEQLKQFEKKKKAA